MSNINKMFSNKIDSSINMQVVKEWRQRYLERSASDPKFYHCGDNAINVGLPLELIEFSNASGGHSGYSSGARPTGIRYAVDNPARALAEIFESDESLAKFISGSDKSGPAYAQAKRQAYFQKHGVMPGIKIATNVTPINPKNRMMRTVNINSEYGAGTLQTLLAKYPNTVKGDYQTLTVGEFEVRYNLGDKAVVA